MVTLRSIAFANGWSAFVICVASSRVGASTKPLGLRIPWLLFEETASLATIGIPNAKVLPDPVLPLPRTSRPANVSGSESTWMGNGVSMPCALSTAAILAGTPRSIKVFEDIM